MKLISKYLILFLFFLLSNDEIFAQLSSEKIGSKINDFRLKNIDNSFVSLNSIKEAKGFIIVFTCNHCPFAKLYCKRLNALNKKYKALGVPLIAINSMDSLVYKEESFELMKTKARKDKFNFYYLQDGAQSVAKSFGATHTPQAYIIWSESGYWVIKYAGAIDDNGEHPNLANSYIANAVDELLAGKEVSKPVTESFGCKIFYRKN